MYKDHEKLNNWLTFTIIGVVYLGSLWGFGLCYWSWSISGPSNMDAMHNFNLFFRHKLDMRGEKRWELGYSTCAMDRMEEPAWANIKWITDAWATSAYNKVHVLIYFKLTFIFVDLMSSYFCPHLMFIFWYLIEF